MIADPTASGSTSLVNDGLLVNCSVMLLEKIVTKFLSHTSICAVMWIRIRIYQIWTWIRIRNQCGSTSLHIWPASWPTGVRRDSPRTPGRTTWRSRTTGKPGLRTVRTTQREGKLGKTAYFPIFCHIYASYITVEKIGSVQIVKGSISL